MKKLMVIYALRLVMYRHFLLDLKAHSQSNCQNGLRSLPQLNIGISHEFLPV